MMKLYAVSDGLTALRNRLPNMAGAVLDRTSIGFLIEEVEELRDQALRYEFEISRHRWNDLARREMLEHEDRVLEAAHRPGSNVTLFPTRPAPMNGAA